MGRESVANAPRFQELLHPRVPCYKARRYRRDSGKINFGNPVKVASANSKCGESQMNKPIDSDRGGSATGTNIAKHDVAWCQISPSEMGTTCRNPGGAWWFTYRQAYIGRMITGKGVDLGNVRSSFRYLNAGLPCYVARAEATQLIRRWVVYV